MTYDLENPGPALRVYLYYWIIYRNHVLILLPSKIQLYYQEGVGIPLTGLALPHLCACPKPGPGFPMSYVMIFSIFIIYNLMFF
jgi:hypothetical protein